MFHVSLCFYIFEACILVAGISFFFRVPLLVGRKYVCGAYFKKNKCVKLLEEGKKKIEESCVFLISSGSTD